MSSNNVPPSQRAFSHKLPRIDDSLRLIDLPQFKSYTRAKPHLTNRTVSDDEHEFLLNLPISQIPLEQWSAWTTLLSMLHQAFLDPNNGPHTHDHIRSTTAHYYLLCSHLDGHYKKIAPQQPKDSIALTQLRTFLTHRFAPLSSNVMIYGIEDLTQTDSASALSASTTYYNVQEFHEEHPQLCILHQDLCAQILLGYFDVFAHQHHLLFDHNQYQSPSQVSTSALIPKNYSNPLLRLLYYSMDPLSQNSGERLLYSALETAAAPELISALSFSFGLLQPDPDSRTEKLFLMLLQRNGTVFSPEHCTLFLKTLEPLYESNDATVSHWAFFALDHYLIPGKLDGYIPNASDIDYLMDLILKQHPPENMAHYLIQKAQRTRHSHSTQKHQESIFNDPSSFHTWSLMTERLFCMYPHLVNYTDTQGHSFAYVLNQNMKQLQETHATHSYVLQLLERTFLRWVKQHQLNPQLMAPVFIPEQHCATPALLSLFEKKHFEDQTASESPAHLARKKRKTL